MTQTDPLTNHQSTEADVCALVSFSKGNIHFFKCTRCIISMKVKEVFFFEKYVLCPLLNMNARRIPKSIKCSFSFFCGEPFQFLSLF